MSLKEAVQLAEMELDHKQTHHHRESLYRDN